MIRSTDSSHVLNLIPDFVLGLLPGDDAQWVAAHVSCCGVCRQALVDEEAIGRAVRSTLERMSPVDSRTFQRLAPDAPALARATLRRPRWSPGLAAAALTILLLVGALTLFAGLQPGSWVLSAPTAGSTLVLMTDTPTQTATRELTATAEGQQAYSSPVPERKSLLTGQVIPAPAMVPVPIAPIMQ
jgi:hypothetical protein